MELFVRVGLVGLLVLSGCAPSPAGGADAAAAPDAAPTLARPSDEPSAAEPSARPSAGRPVGPADAHGPAGHTHATGHGGEVRSVGDLHVELRFLPSGVLVWLSDAAEHPLDLEAVRVEAAVRGPAGVERVLLVPMGDHLRGAVLLPMGAPAEADLTMVRGGRTTTASFATPAVGSLAAHDHTALHGGQVAMWKDTHVEYRAEGGTLRFWVTDARRVPIREQVAGEARFRDTRVPLRFDAPAGLLHGPGRPSADSPVSLDVTVGAESFSLTF